MAFLEKLKFWKKKDDFNLDQPLGFQTTGMQTPDGRLGLPSAAGPDDFMQPHMPMVGPMNQNNPYSSPIPNAIQTNQSQENQIIAKDLEIVNSKLDVLKACLDSISQRLENIERNSREDGSKRQQRKYEW